MKELIGPEMAQRIEAELTRRHASDLVNAALRVEGFREGQRLFARITLTSHDKTLHYPMEAGISLEGDSTKEEEEGLTLALDFLTYYVEQYFESRGEILLPLEWASMRFADNELFVRGWEYNLALEEAADRWLAGESVDVPECADDRRKRRKPGGSPQ